MTTEVTDTNDSTGTSDTTDITTAGKKSRKWLSVVIEIVTLLAAVLLIYILRISVYETAIITSGSMEPTMYKHDRGLVDHRKALAGHWRRGDVVLFVAPEAWGEDDQMLVKRIIGLPGENLEIKNGQVFVDGNRLVEGYIKEPIEGEVLGPYHLGATEYFVMGDNRGNSEDSRQHGPIDGKYLHGRFTLIVAPLDHIARVKPPAY